MNRYIKAMEIGLANERNGISYINLIDKLEKDLNYKLDYSAELTFIEWFSQNFSSDLHTLDYVHRIQHLRFYQSDRDGVELDVTKKSYADGMKKILSNSSFLL